MKKLILMIITNLIPFSAYAAPIDEVALDSLTVHKLNNVKTNNLRIIQSYPGKDISGSCKIVIRTRQYPYESLNKLALRLEFKQAYSSAQATMDSSNRGALVFALKEHSFVDGILITTKDGKSIAKNVAEVFPDNRNGESDVGVMAGVCE
jgi:hypothetical protein